MVSRERMKLLQQEWPWCEPAEFTEFRDRSMGSPPLRLHPTPRASEKPARSVYASTPGPLRTASGEQRA